MTDGINREPPRRSRASWLPGFSKRAPEEPVPPALKYLPIAGSRGSSRTGSVVVNGNVDDLRVDDGGVFIDGVRLQPLQHHVRVEGLRLWVNGTEVISLVTLQRDLFTHRPVCDELGGWSCSCGEKFGAAPDEDEFSSSCDPDELRDWRDSCAGEYSDWVDHFTDIESRHRVDRRGASSESERP